MSNELGRYRKVYPRLWRHDGFASLKPSARELALYILSGPQTTAIGLFHFSVGTAAEDLNVGVETLLKGLANVRATFGWHYDADARVLYIPSWWRWNHPENPNVLRGNLKALNEIRPCALAEAFARNTSTLHETLRETFVECCRQRLGQRSPNQDQYQEQYQEQKQEHARADGIPTGTPRPIASKNGNYEEHNAVKRETSVRIARQVLSVTNPDAGVDHLLDAFFEMCPKSFRPTRSMAIDAISAVISEARTS